MNRFFDIDSFKEIIDSLMKNKSRSLLTGFGVFWGIFMLLFLMGGGDGIRRILVKNFDGFATNSGFVIPGETAEPYKGFKTGRSIQFTQEDVEVLKKKVPEAKYVCGMLALWSNVATYDGRTSDCNGKGVPAEYAYVEAPSMKYGRYINKIDVEQERKVCVIGKKVYEELFPDGGDPCGEFIQLSGVYFQVIGVDVHTSGVSINGRSDEAVSIPVTTVQKVFSKGNRVHFFALVAQPGVKIHDVIDKCYAVLYDRHYIKPGDTKAITSVNAEEIFGIMDNLFKGLDILIWLVGFGTLLAAAIGVSNIMMVTVRERTVEIGIRRAIGATPKMILMQIMSESVMLTFVAGMLGIMLSVMVLNVLEMAVAHTDTPVPFQVSFWSAMAVVVILMALGVLAGLAPAMRAMAIKPVDAMRDE